LWQFRYLGAAIAPKGKKVLRPIGATILPTATRPEIEIDEPWSYVGKKSQVVWHWVAVERATKRVVGWAVGDRSAATCRKLWASLPADYRKRGIFYTDAYFIYRQVLPASRHRPRPKGHGATSQVDRAHMLCVLNEAGASLKNPLPGLSGVSRRG
jgi:IS1 family transposase